MIAAGRPNGRVPLLFGLAVAAVAVEAVVAAWWVRRRFLRFEVAGTSMLPALEPGDFVVVDTAAYRDVLPHRGDVVLARDPRAPGFTLVKRVSNVDLHQGVLLLGDNPEESTDSRTFGPLPAGAIVGRVRWRYWPLRSLVRVR